MEAVSGNNNAVAQSATASPSAATANAAATPQANAQAAATDPKKAKNNKSKKSSLIDNTLGRFFNILPALFTKASHGVTFLTGLIKNDTSAFQIQKSSGAELQKELNKVQNESAEYIKQADKDDRIRVERDKGKKLKSFRYKVKDSRGKVVSNTFDAPTISDVKVFLQNEGYEIVDIKERSKYDVDLNFNTKIKNGDLAFMLTQLSTYIKAGVPLINSVRILAKQTTNAAQKKILNKVVYELVVGEKFSIALEKQGTAFPTLLINMVKTSEMTGDLAGTLDEMAA